MNRNAFALVATAALLGAAPAALAQTARPRAAGVRVQLMEWMVMRAPAGVRAGTVGLTVRNMGKQPHDLVVLRVGSTRAMLPMKGAVALERGLVAKTRVLAPSGAQTLRVKLARGSYLLICNLPGHYMAGMKATLRVS